MLQPEDNERVTAVKSTSVRIINATKIAGPKMNIVKDGTVRSGSEVAAVAQVAISVKKDEVIEEESSICNSYDDIFDADETLTDYVDTKRKYCTLL